MSDKQETTDRRSRSEKVWLWWNADNFVAYDHQYPCDKNGDPLVLGEPVAVAFLRPSYPEGGKNG